MIMNRLCVLFITALMSGLLLASCGGGGAGDEENYGPDFPAGGDDDTEETGRPTSSLQVLLNHRIWTWYASTYDSGFFVFGDHDKIGYVRSGKPIGSYGYAGLSAEGTFTLSGNIITANYTEVFTDPGDIDISKYFPGCNLDRPKTVRYTIVDISDNELILTDGSERWYLTPEN